MVVSPTGYAASNASASLLTPLTDTTVQLSVAVAAVMVTIAPQLPVSLSWVISAGQVISGSIISTTVTVALQVEELPLASVTVSVTGLSAEVARLCEPRPETSS
ncbi:hypothetical protein DSECCO2_376690 [anaerobic digester metagenome]